MRKTFAAALMVLAGAFSQAHANTGPEGLVGKWDVWGPDGKQIGTYEFGPLSNGQGTLLLSGTIKGEARVFTMKYKAILRGNEVLVEVAAEGRGNLDCMTVEFMSADAAQVRQHGCTMQPSGAVGTIRRTGPSSLR